MMDCPNCSNQIPEDSKFCTECGTVLDNNGETTDILPVEDNKSNDNIKDEPDKTKEKKSKTKEKKSKSKEEKPKFKERLKKKLFFPMSVTGLILIIAVVVVLTLKINTPEKATANLFESVDKVNADKFLKVLSTKGKSDLLYLMDFNMAEIANELSIIKEELSAETGVKWIKQINISVVYSDKYQAVVNVIIDGESQKLNLIREGIRWKIMEYPF